MRTRLARTGRLVSIPLLAVLRVYQRVISPMRPPTCRFYPSCSAYAVTAIERFGPVRGTWLAICRLFRCHPWTPGGVDHVPALDPVTGRPTPDSTTPDHDHHPVTAGRAA